MRKLWTIAFVAVLAAGACFDVGNDTTEATDDAEPTATEQIQAGGECTDNSEVDGQADLEMQDFSFAPPCLQINTNQGLRVHNEGDVAHNLSVENIAGIDIDVQPGEENNTEATGLTPGKYSIFCKFHRGSNDMEGELRVVPA